MLALIVTVAEPKCSIDVEPVYVPLVTVVVIVYVIIGQVAVIVTGPVGLDNDITPVELLYSKVAPVTVIDSGNLWPPDGVIVTLAVLSLWIVVSPVAVPPVIVLVIEYVSPIQVAVIVTLAVGLDIVPLPEVLS